ncbi:MAG: Lrp/AsnC ligand binding domain-containing protein [Clostridium sp.]|nr:MAG: Lrp/AsnC ligand binding domain-containing protein [Clostridium sp.]
MTHDTTEQFINAVSTIPQIVECYTITGDGCFLVKIVAKDLVDYRNFVLDKLTSIPFVSDVDTSMVVGVEKQTYSVPIE